MKIQIVSDRSIRYDCKYDITYSTLNKPKSLDSFDINIFSLQDSRIWKCQEDVYNMLNCTNDLSSIERMINGSNNAINIIVLPQNYVHLYYYLKNERKYYYRIELKDEIENLRKNLLGSIIPECLAYSYTLIYENSETTLNKSVFNSAFSFDNVYGEDVSVLTKSMGGNKATTIKKGNLILTTLDISSSEIDLEVFLKGINLDNEKIEYPEWLTEFKCFDDKQQEDLIDDNNKQIERLNSQIDSAKEKLEENLKYKSILITNGSELVETVFEMLEKMLDCNLQDFEDKNIEDFIIPKTDITFVGEIKGVTSNVKSEHVAQLDRHYQAYRDRLAEENRTENVKSILIISPFRTKQLSERGEVHENQIQLAKRNESLIITTDTFLKLYEMFVSDSITSETIINVFKTKIGLLEESDFIQGQTCITNNSSYIVN